MLASEDTNAALAGIPAAGPDSPSPKKSAFTCWGKWWYIMLVIISWIIAVAAIGATGYCTYEGKLVDDKYKKVKNETTTLEKQILFAQKELEQLLYNLETRKKELEDREKDLSRVKTEYNQLFDQYNKYAAEFNTLRRNASDIGRERDNLIKQAAELAIKNNETTHKNDLLTKDIAEAKRLVTQYGSESTIFKITAVPIGLGIIGLGVDLYFSITNAQTIQQNLNKYLHLSSIFDPVAEGALNYEILRVKNKKVVNKDRCFHGFLKEDLKNCQGSHMTRTLINSQDGYRLGAMIFAEFNPEAQAITDSKAFTYSDLVGAMTTINKPERAVVLNKNALLQFGNGDIVIGTDKTVTVREVSYTIPEPYTEYNFYHPTSKFNASDVEIFKMSVADGE